MQLETTRFGVLQIDPNGILLFPDGIVGFEEHRHWVLLGDANEAVGWLQSLTAPEVAMPVVTPMHFVSDYQLRFRRDELAQLPWSPYDEALVLAIVSRHEGQLTANLKAPVILNLHRGMGRQVLTCDDQPLQFPLMPQVLPLRKSA